MSEQSGLAIAIGSFLDNIPESIALGIGLLEGTTVGLAILAGIFISNFPEGLSSAADLKAGGSSASKVYEIWIGNALICGISSLVGYILIGQQSPYLVAFVLASAAGATLAMITDTMIPEAFSDIHSLSGAVSVFGFISAFALTKLV